VLLCGAVHHAGTTHIALLIVVIVRCARQIRSSTVMLLIGHQHLSPQRTLCVLPTLQSLVARVEAYEGCRI